MSTATSPIPATLHLSPHVLAAAGGDREAFAHLVDATSSLVSSIALAILRDVEASRDVAHSGSTVWSGSPASSSGDWKRSAGKIPGRGSATDDRGGSACSGSSSER